MKFLGAVVNDRAVLSARGRGNGRWKQPSSRPSTAIGKAARRYWKKAGIRGSKLRLPKPKKNCSKPEKQR